MITFSMHSVVSLLYAEYKKLADAENKVIFGGRLGEYKYYDMDLVIAAVLDRWIFDVFSCFPSFPHNF